MAEVIKVAAVWDARFFEWLEDHMEAVMAMDREAWNQAMTGGEGYLYRGSLVPPGHAASYEVLEEEFPYAYDPDRARALLEEYAAEKGISLPLSTLSAFTCSPEQAATSPYPSAMTAR